MAKPKKKPAPKKPAAKAKAKPPAAKKKAAAKPMGMSFGHTALLPVLTGIRSVIYKVTDVAVAKKFYQSALGKPPYFDQPFYVGFDIDGQELGLDPDSPRGLSKVGTTDPTA